jgi:hypothetical protein
MNWIFSQEAANFGQFLGEVSIFILSTFLIVCLFSSVKEFIIVRKDDILSWQRTR